MPDPDADVAQQESRIARRIERLFRFERVGRFARRPVATQWRLVERRGALLAELTRLERRRRMMGPAPPELGAALRDLWREADLAQGSAEALAATLGAELHARRGTDAATGLRHGGDGRTLGRG